METKKTTIGGRTEILANDHYAGIPITVAVSSGTTVKAGTPLKSDGTVAADADVAGILLYDVNSMNPNGTIVVHGFIETAKAQNHSGVTITSDMKSALPMIHFN